MRKKVFETCIRRVLGLGLSALMMAGGIGEMGATSALAATTIQNEDEAKATLAAKADTAALKAKYGEARAELQKLAGDNYIIAAVNLVTDYKPLKEVKGVDGNTVVADNSGKELPSVSSGKTVFITDFALAGSYDAPAYYAVVTYSDGDEIYSGLIPAEYVASSDKRYLAWQESYGIYENLPFGTSKEDAENYTNLVGATEKTAKDYKDIVQFPESYQSALLELKKAHPNWTFVKQDTKIKWENAVTAEASDARSLIYYTLPAHMRDMAYDSTGLWYYATKDTVAYYLDPRTYLSEDNIFAMELMTYDEKLHTVDALEKMFDGTFMDDEKGTVPGFALTYATFITAFGKEWKVSPFYLGARILQEQGTAGTSAMISGTYKGYEGYYNYFNIGAVGEEGKGSSVALINGLEYAKKQGWDTRYKAMELGSKIIAENYILKGQDTLYLQKFNVNPDSTYPTYTHQYMQNLTAPATEGLTMRKLYTEAGTLDSAFVFKIPVFTDMYAYASEYPKDGDTISLTIPKGYEANIMTGSELADATFTNGYYSIKMNGVASQYFSVVKRNDKGLITDFYVWKVEKAAAGNYVITDMSASSVKDANRYTGWLLSPSTTTVTETEDEIITVVKKGKWYYLQSGKICTGWKKIDKKWYYLNDDGHMQGKGWVQVDKTWYFIQQNGTMATGWLKRGNNWYYLGDDGVVRTGWKKIKGNYYFFNESGVMQTGWKQSYGKWYYLKSDGKMATGWLQRGNKWYYMDENGAMSTGLVTLKKGTYYFGTSGVMQTGWIALHNDYYYFASDGKMATGWLQRGENRYYMGTNGVMQTGWVKADGKWYYMNPSGWMQTGWQQIDGAWYFFNNNGTMVKGWLQRGSKWYYFDKGGVLVTGKCTIDGKDYTFDENGVLI